MYSAYTANNRFHTSAKHWLLFLFGLSVSFAAIACMQLELKWAIFTMVALALPFAAIFTGDVQRCLTGLLIFSIPLNADVQFYLNPSFAGADSIALGATDIFLLVLLGFWVTEIATSKRKGITYLYPEITIPTVALILLGFISMFHARDLLKSFFDIIQHVKVFVLFIFLANHLRNRKDIQFALVILFFGVLVQAVFMSLQYYKGANLGLLGLGEAPTVLDFEMQASDIARPGGTIGHCNHLSRYVGLLLPIALVLAYVRTSRKMKWLAVTTALAGILILVLTFTRSAWFGVVLSVAVIVPFLVTRRLASPRTIRNVAISFVLFLILLVAFRGPIIGRLTGDDAGSARTRITTAKVAWAIIKDHPFLGVGFNNYGEVLEKYWDVEDPFTRKAAVHNTYLLYAAELGIIGLIAYLLLLIGFYDQIRRAMRSRDKFLAAVAVGAAGGFWAMALMALTDKSYKENLPLMMLFWTIAAIAVAINHIESNRIIIIPKREVRFQNA